MKTADRLLMHIGHSKTGTSSIQATLQASHKFLLQNAILNPTTSRRTGNNKILLPYLFGSAGTRNAEPKRKQIAAKRAAIASAHAWDAVVHQVGRIQPQTIILSSEQFFRSIGPEGRAALDKSLRSIADEIEYIAYLRSPHTYFLSALQQRMKFGRNRNLPQANRLRPVLETTFQNLSGQLSLNVFDRSLLTGGDVVLDFFAKHLPQVEVDGLRPPRQELNVTHSAEAMALLQENNIGVINISQSRARAARAIRKADLRVEGASRPRLHPNVKQLVLDRAADDLFWLRDTHGLIFPDIDYSLIRASSGEDPMIKLSKVDDICVLNPERKAEVLAIARRKVSWWRPF